MVYVPSWSPCKIARMDHVTNTSGLCIWLYMFEICQRRPYVLMHMVHIKHLKSPDLVYLPELIESINNLNCVQK